MEGRPLFPERRAYTVDYELSTAETTLYEAVSEYVRDGMNRARRLKDQGEGRRGSTVGFALTVLQRRLASSPEAILRSLERRQARLERRLRSVMGFALSGDTFVKTHLDDVLGRGEDGLDSRLEDLLPAEIEELEDLVVDAATAAQTAAELRTEIATLRSLVELARTVRLSGGDKKWTELRQILTEDERTVDADGRLRKIIIFTEHRDTVNYLVDRIRTLLGRREAVVTIHGGVRGEVRRAVQQQFTSDKDVQVLVATDAAGEGLNLHRAHLMVNYDLPWNPNRIEQRFGRIHRIGQTEVCHLWNIVARDTREGDVFLRLLQKIEQQRAAYQGKVFDVLGEAFTDHSRRDLLIQAIEYGDRPEVRAHLETVIDATVGDGIDRLLAERALYTEKLSVEELDVVRRASEDARAAALQPHHLRAFFLAAFRALGGTAVPREVGRFEIVAVPSELREHSRLTGSRLPLQRGYERITFDRDQVHMTGLPAAELVAPGHPLLDAVVGLTILRRGHALTQGAVLVDATDSGETPRLLVAVSHTIVDGHEPAHKVSRRFQFVELDPRGAARTTGAAPYLDYEATSADDSPTVDKVLDEAWLDNGAEQLALEWALTQAVPEHDAVTTARISAMVDRVRTEVLARLTAEIQYSDRLAVQLRKDEAAGRTIRRRPETEDRRARELERRLERRLAELDVDEQLTVLPPVLEGAAVVIPRGLLDRIRSGTANVDVPPRDEVSATALQRVMDVERNLGRTPELVGVPRTGYDIRSVADDGSVLRIKVLVRVPGTREAIVRRTDAVAARNLADSCRLAIVDSSATNLDAVCYVRRPFDNVPLDDFSTVSVRFGWSRLLAAAEQPR